MLLKNKIDLTASSDIPCICMTIPLFIRVLELVREDVKSDEDLHFIVERIIASGLDECLDMRYYETILSSIPIKK